MKHLKSNKESNKVREFFGNLSNGIDRYIYLSKIRIDLKGLFCLFVFSLISAISFFFSITFGHILLFKIVSLFFFVFFGYSSFLLLISTILRKINKAKKTFFDKIFKALIWVLLFISIPVIVIIKVFDKIVNRRAKKTDNIEIFLFILVIDSIIFINLMETDFSWIDRLYNLFNQYSVYKFSMIIKQFPFEFFIMILLFIVVANLTNFAILLALRLYGFLSIKKSVKQYKMITANNFKPEDDLNGYVKNNLEYKEKENDELKYDLSYIRNSLFRPQLLIFVITFIIVALAPDYFCLSSEQQSDAINVLTIFTLISGYIDKNKEWDKELEKIEKNLFKKNNKDETKKSQSILDSNGD